MTNQVSNQEKKNELNNPHEGEIIFYTTPEGVAKVEVFFSDETFWLGQRSMVELYGVDRLVITKHIGNIFKSKELHEDSVCAKIAHTAQDGKTYTSQFYKLDTFLQFNEYDILNDSGKVSHEIAIQLAEEEFKRFRVEQDHTFESDFEKATKHINKSK